MIQITPRKYIDSWANYSIIPKPACFGLFGEDSLTKPPFGLVARICQELCYAKGMVSIGQKTILQFFGLFSCNSSRGGFGHFVKHVFFV